MVPHPAGPLGLPWVPSAVRFPARPARRRRLSSIAALHTTTQGHYQGLLLVHVGLCSASAAHSGPVPQQGYPRIVLIACTNRLIQKPQSTVAGRAATLASAGPLVRVGGLPPLPPFPCLPRVLPLPTPAPPSSFSAAAAIRRLLTRSISTSSAAGRGGAARPRVRERRSGG